MQFVYRLVVTFVIFFACLSYLWSINDLVVVPRARVRRGAPTRLPGALTVGPPRAMTLAHPKTLNATALQHKLHANMTLLKVNMSDLQAAIRRANSSETGWPLRQANPHPFKYMLNARHTCRDTAVFLLIYVHTATRHHKRRSVIRQTWGDYRQYADAVRIVFVLGVSDNGTRGQDALAYESDAYGDIVQEDFLDTYHNLSYKGVAALKWIAEYCSHARFVLKSDDDIFVNMFTLLRHLKTQDPAGLLMCCAWTGMKVMREGKWKVTKEEFKDDAYPTYCSGCAYVMSTDVVIRLHRASYDVPFFWVDDFYITGLLPMKAGVKHTQFMSTYVLDARQLVEKFTGSQWVSYVFSHVHDLDAIQSVWNKLAALASGRILVELKVLIPVAHPNNVTSV